MPPIHEALTFPNDQALAAYFVVCLNEYGQINEIRKLATELGKRRKKRQAVYPDTPQLVIRLKKLATELKNY